MAEETTQETTQETSQQSQTSSQSDADNTQAIKEALEWTPPEDDNIQDPHDYLHAVRNRDYAEADTDTEEEPAETEPEDSGETEEDTDEEETPEAEPEEKPKQVAKKDESKPDRYIRMKDGTIYDTEQDIYITKIRGEKVAFEGTEWRKDIEKMGEAIPAATAHEIKRHRVQIDSDYKQLSEIKQNLDPVIDFVNQMQSNPVETVAELLFELNDDVREQILSLHYDYQFGNEEERQKIDMARENLMLKRERERQLKEAQKRKEYETQQKTENETRAQFEFFKKDGMEAIREAGYEVTPPLLKMYAAFQRGYASENGKLAPRELVVRYLRQTVSELSKTAVSSMKPDELTSLLGKKAAEVNKQLHKKVAPKKKRARKDASTPRVETKRKFIDPDEYYASKVSKYTD